MHGANKSNGEELIRMLPDFGFNGFENNTGNTRAVNVGGGMYELVREE